MVHFFQAVFFAIVGAVLVVQLCGITINYKRYPYYGWVYRTLPLRRFTWHKDQLISEDGAHEVVWFHDMNSFQLHEGVYLHTGFPFDFDLYNWYWGVKYRRWFKRYCKANPIN